MDKELVKYGIAAKDYDNAQDAASHTYMTNDGRMVPTPLIFPINPYNEDVKNAKTVLDIGCGVGRNLEWVMKNTYADYIGVDPHPQMLEYFWDVQNREYHKRVELQPNFEALRNPSPHRTISPVSVDVVICTFVFQHIGYRPPEGQMNVTDITKEALKFCHSNTVWIMYEHDWEEEWIGRWMEECEILPQVYIREFAGIPDLAHRRPHHLIIFKQR